MLARLQKIANTNAYKAVCVSAVTSGLAYLPLYDFVYSALLMVCYGVAIRFINNSLIRLAFFILFIYSLLDYIAAVFYAVTFKEQYFQFQLTLFEMYSTIFYVTIALILAGLATGKRGGHIKRNISKRVALYRFNLFDRVRLQFIRMDSGDNKRANAR